MLWHTYKYASTRVQRVFVEHVPEAPNQAWERTLSLREDFLRCLPPPPSECESEWAESESESEGASLSSRSRCERFECFFLDLGFESPSSSSSSSWSQTKKYRKTKERIQITVSGPLFKSTREFIINVSHYSRQAASPTKPEGRKTGEAD